MNKRGFTMVEMMISLTILAMLALSLGVAIIMARKLSEASIYQGTALTAALGYMEQIKSMEYFYLQDAYTSPATKYLPTRLDDATPDYLYCGQTNEKELVIDIDKDGNVIKRMKLTITPTITDLSKNGTGLMAMEIILVYSWTAPDSKLPHTRALRTVRSYVPTY